MSNWASYLPLVLIVIAFWLLVLRPARNRQKEFMATQNALEPGARVMLASGIFGELVAVRDDEVDIRVASDVVLTVARQAVAKIIVPQEAPPADESRRPAEDHRLMAGPPARRNLPKPRRTLLLFLAAVVGMYGLLAVLGATASAKDDSVWKPRLGLDLQGGTRITLQAKATSGDVTPEKLRQARSIIDQRVNATGVTEGEVTTQGGNQVIIEIPGSDESDIVDQVGRTAQLRFRLVWASAQSAQKPADPAEVKKQDDAIAKVDWSKLTLDQIIKAETEGVESLPKEYIPGLNALNAQAKGFVCAKKNLPQEDRADRPLVTCDTKTGEVEVLSPTVIEGTDVKSASAVVPQGQVSWVVALQLKGEGKKTFDTVTEALYQQQQQGNEQGSRFAIVLDGEVLSAPTTNGHFTDGSSQISGNFTATSSKALANQLKYGALPLTFELNGSSFEGPTLAGTQLKAGLLAGAVGLVLVVVYLLLYYRGLGLVAIASLLVATARHVRAGAAARPRRRLHADAAWHRRPHRRHRHHRRLLHRVLRATARRGARRQVAAACGRERVDSRPDHDPGRRRGLDPGGAHPVHLRDRRGARLRLRARARDADRRARRVLLHQAAGLRARPHEVLRPRPPPLRARRGAPGHQRPQGHRDRPLHAGPPRDGRG